MKFQNLWFSYIILEVHEIPKFWNAFEPTISPFCVERDFPIDPDKIGAAHSHGSPDSS